MPEPRQLNFATLNEAVAEAEHLLAVGYEPAGKWNLAQCCGHCSQWLAFVMDGFPRPNPVMGTVMWMMKKTIAKKQLKSILEDGFKPGLPTIPATVPTPDAQADIEAVAELKTTIERFQQYDGPCHGSPLFGELSKEQWMLLHRRHLEHHLGFLVPKE